jgi:hypothetical protein
VQFIGLESDGFPEQSLEHGQGKILIRSEVYDLDHLSVVLFQGSIGHPVTIDEAEIGPTILSVHREVDQGAIVPIEEWRLPFPSLIDGLVETEYDVLQGEEEFTLAFIQGFVV